MSRLRIDGGRFVMTPTGRYASECGGCPAYVASDDSYETDDFSGTFDWTEDVGDWVNSSGKARLDSGSFDNGAYQTFSVTDEESLLIIAEVTINRLDSDTVYSSLSISLSSDSGADQAQLGAVWGSHYLCVTTAGGSTDSHNAGGSPSDGDKLTIAIRGKGSGAFQVCYYVDEVEIHEYNVTSSWDFEAGTNKFWIGIQADDFPAGEFDDYTIQIDE